jgi:hypothetical protein
VISRAHVDAVVDPTLRTIDEILRATNACDFVRAAVIAFARARTGAGRNRHRSFRYPRRHPPRAFARSRPVIVPPRGSHAFAIGCSQTPPPSPIEVVVLYAA